MFHCVEDIWIGSRYQRAVFQWLDTGQELAISIFLSYRMAEYVIQLLALTGETWGEDVFYIGFVMVMLPVNAVKDA
jgi:hypothetical protein